MRCTLSTTEGLPYFDILNNEASKAETTEDNMILYLLLRVYGGKTIDITIQPMLNTGTSALPWEPYTGGQPSPSPDYPQQIVSAGSDGKIGIEVRGKNLVNISDSEFAGTKSIPISLRKGTYWFTVEIGDDNEKPTVAIMLRKDMESVAFYNNLTRGEQNKIRIDLSDNVDEIILYAGIDYKDSLGYKGVFKNIMISVDKPTAYEPYHEPQSLSISTPTRLPAIPVDTDGNYTDANGQQWIADYVDLKRGKYVQRVNSLTLDGDKLKFVADPTNTYWNLPQQSAVKPGGYFILSKYFGKKSFLTNKVYDFIFTTPVDMDGLFETADELNAFVVQKYKENAPVVLHYPMQEPIERDLTPEEIQAYKNLVTYAGTTIVENDAECYMEVSAGGGNILRAKKLALILGE